MTARAWRAPQVCRRTGVTYRQLDHWCRAGLLGERMVDPGSGNWRVFTDQDVAVVRVLALMAPRMLGRSTGTCIPYLFRFVAQEIAAMDLSSGWLVLAPGRVQWVGAAEELPAAWAGLGAFNVVCLGAAAAHREAVA